MSILPAQMKLTHLSRILWVFPTSATATPSWPQQREHPRRFLREQSPHPRRPILKPTYWCPLGMCVWSHLPLTWLFCSYLHSWAQKTVIFGRQEAYLGSSECSSAGCAPDISPTPDFGGVDTRGDSMGGTDRGVSAGGAIVGNDDEGTGAGSADVGRERFSPYLGCPRSGWGGHC
jgi:hypothetical protein